MRSFTLGEILRQGLLKNHKGEPYKHKATISKYAKKIGTEERPTIHGMAKTLTEIQIRKHNTKWSTLGMRSEHPQKPLREYVS